MDDGTVEAAISNANMRMMCIASTMRFVDEGRTQGGYPMVELVDGGNDDERMATITATLLAVLIQSGQLTAYVESAAAAYRRAYGIGEEVGRGALQADLRKLIGMAE